jgi:hypothetical protein
LSPACALAQRDERGAARPERVAHVFEEVVVDADVSNLGANRPGRRTDRHADHRCQEE